MAYFNDSHENYFEFFLNATFIPSKIINDFFIKSFSYFSSNSIYSL